MRPTPARTSRPNDARLIDGTCRLFEFAALVAGESCRSAARRVGHDHRTFRRMREVPSLGLVASIGASLSWDAPVAVALAAIAADPADAAFAGAPRDFPCVAREVLRADLADDAAALERFSLESRRIAATPLEFACSLAFEARALVARGLVDAAMRGIADHRGILRSIPRADSGCDAQSRILGACDACVLSVLGDAALGCPWEPMKSASFSCSRLDSAQHSGSESRCRASAFAIAARAVASARTSAASECLRELERAVESACSPEEHAWCASIAAIAATRVHGVRTRQGLDAAGALSLSIESTFLLEELAESSLVEPGVQRLARTRLARVRTCALVEQCASEPEASPELLASEASAVRAALARFPASIERFGDASPDGNVSSSRFRNFPISPLDGIAGGCWMTRVSSAETGVVSAQPRSEESC
jgi:hypothetical protein